MIDFLLDALGIHPVYRWESGFAGATWRGWYATVTYDLFAQQAWDHFKRLLLFPGENELHLPTRRILEIGWDKKAPQKVLYLKLKRADGGTADISIRSYDQGPGKFQSAGLDRVHLDEEDKSGAIYQEVTMRGVAKKGARISHSCTPVIGVDYVTQLRHDAETGARNVCHARFDTRDNPAADKAYIAEVVKRFRHRPELIDLRLGGFPLALHGLVYNDLVFTPANVCDPFLLPANWTRYRVIDPSWRNCACTWWAVGPREEDLILYRDYVGHEQTIADNCKAILALSGAERFQTTWIDRNYCQKHEEVHGEKIIELYRRNGVACVESVPIGITAGIFDTWELLAQRSGANGERARLRVFRSCENFFQERLKYKWPEAKDKGHEGVENPTDRDNHVLKCFVYFWAARPRWVVPRAPVAPAGSMTRVIQDDRLRTLKPRGRL